MDAVIQEIQTYPEIKSFTLINNYTGEERTVSESHLLIAFGADELTKIRSQRSDYWTLIEN